MTFLYEPAYPDRFTEDEWVEMKKLEEEVISPPVPVDKWCNHYPGGERIVVWLNPKSVEEVKALQDEIFTGDPRSKPIYLIIFITERSAIPFATMWQQQVCEESRLGRKDDEVRSLKHSHTFRPWILVGFSEEDTYKLIEQIIHREAIGVGVTGLVPWQPD